MEIALFGRRADELAARAGVELLAAADSVPYRSGAWRLLALTRDGAARAQGSPLRCHTLLLPGDGGTPESALTAEQVIAYGFSPRDTLTFSSVSGGILCIQRRLVRLDGTEIEPQERVLDEDLRDLAEEHALLLAGIRLLCARD